MNLVDFHNLGAIITAEAGETPRQIARALYGKKAIKTAWICCTSLAEDHHLSCFKKLLRLLHVQTGEELCGRKEVW